MNETVNAVLTVALRALSHKIQVVVSLLLGFSLFAWAAYQPSVLRIVIAVAFAVLIFLPTLVAGAKNG